MYILGSFLQAESGKPNQSEKSAGVVGSVSGQLRRGAGARSGGRSALSRASSTGRETLARGDGMKDEGAMSAYPGDGGGLVAQDRVGVLAGPLHLVEGLEQLAADGGRECFLGADGRARRVRLM